MQGADAEHHGGGEVMDTTAAQQHSLDGVECQFLGVAFSLTVEFLEKLVGDEVPR